MLTIVVLVFLLILTFYYLRSRRPITSLVISLSPANHSPRALAHANSISQHTNTFFIALPPFPSSTHVSHHPLYTPPHPASLFIKLFLQAISLVRALLRIALQNVTTIIVNTPPALPTLPILLLLARPLFPSARLIIDWHNLAYTLMPASSPLTPIAKSIERHCARYAAAHWTVSQAMAHFLTTQFHIHPTVVYDRPRRQFTSSARLLTPTSRHQLLTRLAQCATRIPPHHHPSTTKLLVTSTSWTPDEDFHILYRALVEIDHSSQPLIVAITGRGPLRSTFEQLFRDAAFTNIAVWIAWLPIEDYPRLLASANLGISLHASSSGLDLPMKAVDMLACGLPVVALRYNCIHELIKHQVNGFLFEDSHQLAAVLRRLLFEHPDEIATLRKGVQQTFKEGMEWESYWQRTALPTIQLVS